MKVLPENKKIVKESLINESYEDFYDESRKLINRIKPRKLRKDTFYYLYEFDKPNDYTYLKPLIKNKLAFVINSRLYIGDPCAYIGANDYEELSNYENLYYPEITKEKFPIGVIQLQNTFDDYGSNEREGFRASPENAFTHELRHAYNWYVSKGKGIDLYNVNKDVKHKEEISASISGSLANNWYWYDKQGALLPFSQVIKNFKSYQGINYDSLSKINKKRLIKKLGQIWINKNIKENEKSKRVSKRAR